MLAARGDFEEAARRFQLALARKPDFIDAYNNLARVFLSVGQAGNALGALRRALAIGGDGAKQAAFCSMRRAFFPLSADFEDLRSLLIRALSESWGRANDLAPVAARIVKRTARSWPIVTRVMEAWPRACPRDELLEPAALAAISGDRLLRCLMQSAAIADIELERLLTAIRFALLEIASASKMDRSWTRRLADAQNLDFCCALARQCFLNEQVFACTDDEVDEARRLRDGVVAALASGAAIAELRLAWSRHIFRFIRFPALARSWRGPGPMRSRSVLAPAGARARRRADLARRRYRR